MTGLVPLAEADAAHFRWIAGSPAAKIMAALEARAPGGSRYVGGSVRDSLLGEKPKDFDIATTLLPGDSVSALGAAGLKSAPTGIEHGTVTGIVEHVGVEITTLRSDVSTDGRRATVAFTQDWAADAGRRDFTINAIYLSADGRLFDPVGGVADVRTGRVRFIGEAQDRIREDYLRILRFFRFSARFARGFDADGLSACAALAGGIEKLSAERIGDEFTRILALAGAADAIDAMAATGVLESVWPARPRRSDFRRLKGFAPEAPAALGLAALYADAGHGIDRALRLANSDAARRKAAVKAASDMSAGLDDRAARALLYAHGASAWRDGVLIARARDPSCDWARLETLADRWPPAKFPITGKHVVAVGVPPGPRVSEILKRVEAAWIAEDFPGRGRLDAILAEICSVPKP